MTVNLHDPMKVQQAARLYGMQPYVQDYVDKKVHIIEMRIFQQSDAGTLTTEHALGAWLEVKALRRFLRTVQQDINVGVTVGERLPKPELKPKE